MDRRRFFGQLRRYFKTGLVSLVPTIVVGYILYFLVGKLSDASGWVAGLVPVDSRHWWSDFVFPAIFLILAAALIIIVGVVSTTLVGRGAARFWERAIARIPILSKVYASVQQVITTLSYRNKQVFKSVALVSYPYPGCYRLGFVTSDELPEMSQKEELVAVFVPSTPNPFSGLLFFVAKENITPLDIPVEEGIKLIVSGGFVTPSLARQTGAASMLDSDGDGGT